MGGDHLFGLLPGALGDFGEVGREFRVIVAARDGDAAGFEVDRQAAGDQHIDLGLEIGPGGRQRIVGHHQGPHGGHGLDDAENLAGLAGQADRGMKGHDPAVDLGGNLVAEFDGEGGVAAGEVPNAHIC